MRLAWIEAHDGVTTRGYHGGSVVPVAKVTWNGRPVPLHQDRWIVIVEGE